MTCEKILSICGGNTKRSVLSSEKVDSFCRAKTDRINSTKAIFSNYAWEIVSEFYQEFRKGIKSMLITVKGVGEMYVLTSTIDRKLLKTLGLHSVVEDLIWTSDYLKINTTCGQCWLLKYSVAPLSHLRWGTGRSNAMPGETTSSPTSAWNHVSCNKVAPNWKILIGPDEIWQHSKEVRRRTCFHWSTRNCINGSFPKCKRPVTFLLPGITSGLPRSSFLFVPYRYHTVGRISSLEGRHPFYRISSWVALSPCNNQGL